MRVNVETETICGDLAAELHAQKVSVLEGVGLAIVEIELSLARRVCAGVIGVNAQRERASGFFVDALHEWCDGNDCPCSNEDRKGCRIVTNLRCERRLDGRIGGLRCIGCGSWRRFRNSLPGPVVVPGG